MNSLETADITPRIWGVGVLCRAIADTLDARFNPVAVRGEISGFTRASSGHCYFTLKDPQGQLRCAMFKRSAQMLGFAPKDGQTVEVFGRLGVYEPRGELQLVVESMRTTGQGSWFEQFLKLKAQLEAEGLFDTERKRPIQERPRAIGVVTSLGAAALHDVATALQRRVPHIPVVLSPALVQGADAPASLLLALQALGGQPEIDVILLVRGGGSIEDLWAFNDEQLARAIVACPVPVISGVGHETDFTIADFCADLRAPTPTAAAELCAVSQADLIQQVMALQELMQNLTHRQIDKSSQGLDLAQSRIGRPSQAISQHVLRITRLEQSLHQRMGSFTQTCQHDLLNKKNQLERAVGQTIQNTQQRIHRAQLRLGLLDPKLVLQRGFAWLSDEHGVSISSVSQAKIGELVQATLADGVVDLSVTRTRQ
ncbi:MAG: exodeoxyribonuclease VII large subunit [Betaproteobacteria bacterium]|nr:exodeoxyribonuclease VII large subunit [Betaproteobacteria bacterium]